MPVLFLANISGAQCVNMQFSLHFEHWRTKVKQRKKPAVTDLNYCTCGQTAMGSTLHMHLELIANLLTCMALTVKPASNSINWIWSLEDWHAHPAKGTKTVLPSSGTILSPSCI